MLFVRKIRQSRWLEPPPDGASAGADLLGEFKTDGNALSVWDIGDDAARLDDAVIALATNAQDFSNVDLIAIRDTDLQELGIAWEQKPGDTPYRIFAEYHYDLVRLSAGAIAQLATSLRSRPVEDLPLTRKHRADVIDLVIEKVNQSLINLDHLPEKTREVVANRLDAKKAP